MTGKHLVLGICILLTVLGVSAISAYVYIQNYEKQIKVAAQIEVEKTKIEQEAKVKSSAIEVEKEKLQQSEATKRTTERMKWVPWYKK